MKLKLAIQPEGSFCNNRHGLPIDPIMTADDWRRLGATLQRYFSDDEKARIQRKIIRNLNR